MERTGRPRRLYARLARSRRLFDLRFHGIIPARRLRLWCVKPTNDLSSLELCKRVIPGLTAPAGWYWMRSKEARELIRIDRASGGEPEILKSEFRRCDKCGRALLGAEAILRRQMIEIAPAARMTPCGDNCENDRASGIWMTLMKDALKRRHPIKEAA